MISLIVPVLNEADSLRQLHAEIDRTCREHELAVEMIFVDDGSADASWSLIEALAEEDERVSGIRFRKNFGKAAALTAGMQAASGEFLMTMDADLQDDPAEIPNFKARLDEGFDVVNGWKQNRLDPWHKVYPSKVFNWLVGRMTGLKLRDHNCGIKMFRAEVASEIRIYGELHRFIAVLAHARGFRVTQIPVHHRPRQHGRSKYGMRRFLRGFLDLLTVTFLVGFGLRPSHALGAFGLFFFGLGLIGLGYLAVLWVLWNVPLILDLPAILEEEVEIGTRPLLAYSIASTLLGAQALSLGLLAELIVFKTSREAEQFSVSDRTGLKGEGVTDAPSVEVQSR